jgi:uncharacterized membrane protein YraQ (UPF0718 family)
MNNLAARWAIVTGISFVVAAIGIVVQWKSGVGNAKVPVGAFILAALAILTWLRLWRWTPVVGAVFCVFILVVAFIIGGVIARLSHPDHLGPFVGTLLQMVGLLVAIATGILTAICNAKQS